MTTKQIPKAHNQHTTWKITKSKQITKIYESYFYQKITPKKKDFIFIYTKSIFKQKNTTRWPSFCFPPPRHRPHRSPGYGGDAGHRAREDLSGGEQLFFPGGRVDRLFVFCVFLCFLCSFFVFLCFFIIILFYFFFKKKKFVFCCFWCFCCFWLFSFLSFPKKDLCNLAYMYFFLLCTCLKKKSFCWIAKEAWEFAVGFTMVLLDLVPFLLSALSMKGFGRAASAMSPAGKGHPLFEQQLKCSSQTPLKENNSDVLRCQTPELSDLAHPRLTSGSTVLLQWRKKHKQKVPTTKESLMSPTWNQTITMLPYNTPEPSKTTAEIEKRRRALFTCFFVFPTTQLP